MKIYSNPIIPIYHFDMRSGIWGDRSNIGGADQHENLKMFIQISQLFILRWNQAYKGSDQALVQIHVPRYLYEIHYLLSSHQFGKGTVDMDFSLLLHTSTKGTMMLLSWSGLSKSPPWSPWGPRSGRPHELSRPPPFFKGVLHNLLLPSSTSVWNQRSPLIQWHRFMNTCTECSVSL